MKKVSMLLCARVLMSALCAAFTACNDEPQNPGQQQEGSRGEEQPGEQKDEPTGENVPFTVYSFGEKSPALGVDLGPGYDEQGYKSKLLVINSDEEMEKYVEGDYPAVDFTKHTLLLTAA
ncbi:MAG: hypothetical protein LBU98_02025 [Alistipes sp.]|jgi:hypothetical protein|nr:hypothetical protein [Alistipes sp.]